MKPYFNFSNISCLRVATAIFVFSETLCTQLSGAIVCGTVQFEVQCTENPLLAYLASSFPVG